jgi:hypothetical protein
MMNPLLQGVMAGAPQPFGQLPLGQLQTGLQPFGQPLAGFQPNLPAAQPLTAAIPLPVPNQPVPSFSLMPQEVLSQPLTPPRTFRRANNIMPTTETLAAAEMAPESAQMPSQVFTNVPPGQILWADPRFPIREQRCSRCRNCR